MTLWCHICENWSSLPPRNGDGTSPLALCRHCGTPLPGEHVESRLANVGPEELVGPALFEFEDQPTQAEIAKPTMSIVAKKQPTRRGDDYYWQLYFDYTSSEREQVAEADSHAPSEHSNGSNGAGLGNGNGNGSHSSVDLAITETVPLTLFGDSEMGAKPDTRVEAGDGGEAKVEVKSAGSYNDFEFELIDDPSRLAQVAEMLARETTLGIDTETTGLDPHTSELLLLQLSTTDKVYIVDCKRLVPLALKPLLENPDILKIAQNAKFEYEMLKQQTGITLAGIFDTMLAERICTAGIGREISLKQIAAKYIGAVLDKTVREAFYKLSNVGDAYLAPEQLHYAARDAFIMIPIWRLQKAALKRHRLEQVADLEFRCVAAVGDLELAGVKIDEARWRKIIEDVGVQREKSAAELCEMLQPATMQATMFGVPSINLNSSTQLMEVFGKLGVELPDTSEATLSRFNHPAVAKLLEYRSFEKTLSAFGENVLSLINPRTGRIHPDFNQHGADTGRFSCTRPNVQQIPTTSDFRTCFIAPEGYKLVTCDYSQCVAKDTWVSFNGGWVRIQDHPDSVSKGYSETVVVTTERKYRLECTPDHRILTHRGWVDASDLQDEDWVALANKSGDVCEEPLNDLWWLVGFWVGDGSSSKAPTIAYFAKGEEPYTSELRAFITQTLGVTPKEWGDSFGLKGQRSFNSIVYGLFNKKSLRLPLDRIEHLPSFLSGLFDADGSADKNGVSFATKFIELAQDVQIALLRFGVMSTITPSRSGYNFVPGGTISYRVRISDKPSLRNFAHYINFRFSRKAAILQHTLSIKTERDQGNYLPIPAEHMRELKLPYKRYVFNHIHGRPYTRERVLSIGQTSAVIDDFSRYHWDRVSSVEQSGRSIEVFDLMDQTEQRFEAAGFIVHNCELRILAELSGDPGFVSAFVSGGDLHAMTASQMFNVPLEEVQKAQRSAAKAINFGLAYGMGPGGLAPRLGVSLDEAKTLIARYFKAYPGVQAWLDRAAKDAVRLGYSVTNIGRKRFYTLPDESLKRSNEDEWRKQIASIERQGKNSPIQGSNADMTKLALIYLRTALKNWDARTVNTVHDEIVVEVRADQAEEVKHTVERCMVRAGEDILKEVPIVAEAALADYWSK